MTKLRVKVMGSGKPGDPFCVNLPAYIMVPGSEKYDPEIKGKLVTVEILVPDDEVDEKGQLSLDKIRAKYRGQPHWDRADLLKDVIVREKKRKGNT